MAVDLYAHRCVLGVSPPRCSRVSLASFSSGGDGGSDHTKLAKRMRASKTVREDLIEVRESHSDFRPRDAATACQRIARHVRSSGITSEIDEDRATYQLALQAVRRTASGMNAQEVSNTLWAFGTLAEKGIEIDVAAAWAVSRQVPRVAAEMNTQSMVQTLCGIAILAEKKGVEVDLAAVRAASEQAPRVAAGMKSLYLSKTMWAMAKLAEMGVEVDAAAVRAMSEQAPLVADLMKRGEVSVMLWAIAQLEQKGVEVDAEAMRAVSERAVVVKRAPRHTPTPKLFDRN